MASDANRGSRPPERRIPRAEALAVGFGALARAVGRCNRKDSPEKASSRARRSDYEAGGWTARQESALAAFARVQLLLAGALEVRTRDIVDQDGRRYARLLREAGSGIDDMRDAHFEDAFATGGVEGDGDTRLPAEIAQIGAVAAAVLVAHEAGDAHGRDAALAEIVLRAADVARLLGVDLGAEVEALLRYLRGRPFYRRVWVSAGGLGLRRCK